MSRHRSRVVEKRKKRSDERLRADRLRCRSFDRILKSMGLDAPSGKFVEMVSACLAEFSPKPRVIPDPAQALDDDLESRTRELQRDLERVTIRIGREVLSHADFFTFCAGFHSFVQCRARLATTTDEERWWSRFILPLKEFTERYTPEMMEELDYVIRRFLASHSRLDGPVYTARHQAVIVGGKYVCTTIVGRTRPETVTVESNGVPRRAFRCGAFECIWTGKTIWIDWPPPRSSGWAQAAGSRSISRVTPSRWRTND